MLSAALGRNGRVVLEEDSSLIGTLEEQMAQIFRLLGEQKDTRLQLVCTVKQEQSPSSRRSTAARIMKHSVFLSAILYGPLALFQHVGDLLDKYNIFLQDPIGCDQNVRYRNPHRLSGLDPDVPMTIDRELEQLGPRRELTQRSRDWLADLGLEQELPETEASRLLATNLFRHAIWVLFVTKGLPLFSGTNCKL
jgi:SWI/SNF-related matrix-associated actin-dependent regulator of chromatin subfamily A3